jgi:GGDEF domain-containing protein
MLVVLVAAGATAFAAPIVEMVETSFESLDGSATSGGAVRSGLLAVGGLLATAAVVAGGLAVRRRRHRRLAEVGLGDTSAPPVPLPVESDPSLEPATAAEQDRLVAARRRISDATDAGAVARIAVREAMAIADADEGALVTVGKAGSVLQWSTDGFLDATSTGAGLDGGVVAAAAAIGRTHSAHASADPTVTRDSGVLLAVPVVHRADLNGGCVVGVVLLGRHDVVPFTTGTVDMVERFAPIVAPTIAAMAGITSAAAVTTATRRDPVTGLANEIALLDDLCVVLAPELAEAPDGAAVELPVTGIVKVAIEGVGSPSDAVVAAASAITGAIRTSDTAYRWNDGEFVVVLRAVTVEQAAEVTDRMQSALAAQSLSASLGVALVRSGSPGEALAAADAALRGTGPDSGLPRRERRVD